MDELYCSIEYTLGSSLFDDDESVNSITSIRGVVVSHEEDDEEVVVAKTHHYYIDVDSAMNAGEDSWSLLDYSSDTAIFMELYESGSGEFSSNVLEALGLPCTLNSNLLIANRVEILPKYRGRGLSKKITDDVVRLFSGSAEVLAIKSFPLQLEAKHEHVDLSKWEKGMALNELEKDSKVAQESLTANYEKQGYQNVGSNGLMVKLIN